MKRKEMAKPPFLLFLEICSQHGQPKQQMKAFNLAASKLNSLSIFLYEQFLFEGCPVRKQLK